MVVEGKHAGEWPRKDLCGTFPVPTLEERLQWNYSGDIRDRCVKFSAGNDQTWRGRKRKTIQNAHQLLTERILQVLDLGAVLLQAPQVKDKLLVVRLAYER